LETDAPGFLDRRDRGGWTDDTRDTGPKMAALIAEAAMPKAGMKSVDVISEGRCLILGKGDVAFEAAAQLAEALAVTLLQLDATDPPPRRDFDVIRGRLKTATGALGGFAVAFDAFQQIDPGGRGDFRWTEPRDGARSECDVILDLGGDAPQFSAHEKR